MILLEQTANPEVLAVSWETVVFTIINLLILFVAFRFTLFKPVNKIIAERQSELEEGFKEAQTKKEEADALKTQYEDSIKGIEKQKNEVISQAKKDADVIGSKIIEEARDEADKIKQTSSIEANAMKEQIIKSAQKEIADMVVDATKKVSAGAKIDESLYDEFLNEAGE